MLRQFCFEEVELHNTEQDCWVVLGPLGGKRVYDLTAFLEDHPGGPELLLDLAGQDVHEEFEDIGHSNAAREMLQKLCIGELKDDRDARTARSAQARAAVAAAHAVARYGRALRRAQEATADAPAAPQNGRLGEARSWGRHAPRSRGCDLLQYRLCMIDRVSQVVREQQRKERV